MRNVATIIIGAGHAGLAMSRCLTERSIDHIVLERGEVANSWRTERWDSLRLLTPNWQSRLPGFAYQGDDPNGFMTMPDVIDYIDDYATAISAPVRNNTKVTSVSATDRGYLVETDRGNWHGRTIVLATGACNVAHIPKVSEGVPAHLSQVTPMHYRNPEQLEQGGVLVVGASATGMQLADEIHCSGRPVTMAVGEHVRVPRTYRGRDIKWWMDVAGVLDQDYTEIDDLTRARGVPSLQLIGSPERKTIDLNSLGETGIKFTGRLAGMRDGTALFSGGLSNQCALADLKMDRLLDVIDEWAGRNGLDGEVAPVDRFAPTKLAGHPPLGLDLNSGEIKTIIWATGYKPNYDWLDVPVLDRKGRICHDGGIVDAPGMYVMGLPFMRRRKSSLIDGAADDARALCAHLASYLDSQTAIRQNALRYA